MDNSDCEKADSALINIWSRIRDELAQLQDLAKNEFTGQVVNPISGSVYSQNTGCAALVFVTEYIRNGDSLYLLRARRALESLQQIDVHSGLAEPKWNRIGWHNNRGSLFTTGTLLDVIWKTQNLLGNEASKEDLLPLLHYLETCKISPGLYSHDSVNAGQNQSCVQNTTAIALYLTEEIAIRNVELQNALIKDCNVTLHSLLKGQRDDGFWSYVFPDALQRTIHRFPRVRSFVSHLPIVRRYFLVSGDSSIFFGDAVHHCLVLYYFTKSLCVRQQPSSLSTQAVIRGWNWIENFLLETDYGGLRFDFSWEPTPTVFRYANFRDTSTYFLILAMLPLLVDLGIASREDYHRISNGILIHVERKLLQDTDSATSIKPYEGPDAVLKWILPRVGEASAWKGALLAEFILSRRKFISDSSLKGTP